MTKKEKTEKIKLEYALYKDSIGDVGTLENLLGFISNEREMSERELGILEVQMSRNKVDKILTMICWPIVSHYSCYPPCAFYDRDNELIDLQIGMIGRYHNCLERLVNVANQDNMRDIYGLAKFTVDKHTSNFALVSNARSYNRDAAIGHKTGAVDLSMVDEEGFLDFFDEAIVRESGNTNDKQLCK